MGANSQEQGATFETLLHELLTRLLRDDLGYELVQNTVQSSGIQYGKDIQTKWRDKDGQEHFWHFECKSHQGGVLHQKEVADKIIDAYRSAHRIDVWCLALAHIEPGVWIDEVFTWGNERLNLPFYLAVLSPGRGFIRELFASHPDLFARLYPQTTLVALSVEERAKRIGSVASFLREATQKGRQLALRPHGEWELVSPNRLRDLPNRPEQKRAYLRGATPTCPWEAVVHGWTVTRASAEKPILFKLQGADPGLSYCCIVGAGGEGKSTLLRRIAWHTATALEGWTVLWADAQLAQQAAQLPLRWIEALADGAKVLVCVDGSRQISGLNAGLGADWELRDAKKQVFVLLADRGNEWFRSPTRMDLLKARSRPDDHKHMLAPLEPAEQESIARLLSSAGLLYGKSLSLAVQRIRDAATAATIDANQPYLLPTMMQLTDPADRKFEVILESVLSDLAQLPDHAALRLILATSVFHGAGTGLPRRLAERLVGSADKLDQALVVLQAELEKQGWDTQNPLIPSMTGDRYFAHHAVVADGVLTAAYGSSEHKGAFLTLCRDMPTTMSPDLDAQLRLPDLWFEILDRTPVHLDEELHIFEAAERFLRGWISLDSRRFPTVHRLGECYSRWLQTELKRQPVDKQLAQHLLTNGRATYQESIATARRVLLGPTAPPPWFANYSYRAHESKAYHAWAVLEDTAAMHVADPGQARPLLLRAILLSLLSFEPHDRHQNAGACGTLSLQLIHLGEFDLAAKVTAASIELRNKRSVVNSQRRMLQEYGVQVPRGGVELLDGVFASLCTGLLLQEWESIGLFRSRGEHIDKLLDVLARALEWLPAAAAIAGIRVHLGAVRGG